MLLAVIVSILAFLVFFLRHEVLLYGDAVAHINIARRVFDSLTPGPLQLGTVWLPLPHILTIPFVVPMWMWRSGVGGSIASMAAYVAGTLGVFQLVRHAGAGFAGAWLAAIIYAANPNLLYLQSTAMTEPLHLALFVWAMVFAMEFSQGLDDDLERVPRALERCALLLAAAMLTRYDGWFLAGCLAVVLAAIWLRWRVGLEASPSPALARRLRRAGRNFVLLLVAVPALWLAYNYREFGNPLEFANGPYSARAIEQRSATAWEQHHPGYENLHVAASYFLKAAKLNLGVGLWQLPLIVAALLGVLLAVAVARQFAILLLLWIPLPFYSFSIAYEGVPLFLPVWWPFSYYNVRYGLQLLPAVAVFAALAFWLLARLQRVPLWRGLLTVVAIVVVAGSYWSVLHNTPICLREAHANGEARYNFDIALASHLERLPAGSRLLMYSGEHPGALETAGIPLRRVVNETNHPYWEQAVSAPARQVDYVVALDPDEVAQAVASHPEGLQTLVIIESTGQPRTRLYKSLLRNAR